MEMEGLEPPQVAIIRVLSRIGVWAKRLLYPFGRENRVPAPHTTVQIELSELEEIATP